LWCTKLQPNLKPIQTWKEVKEVLSKRVPILGEGIACNQEPDSLHCKALKRAKALGELKIKSLSVRVTGTVIGTLRTLILKTGFRFYNFCELRFRKIIVYTKNFIFSFSVIIVPVTLSINLEKNVNCKI
jgi:hypothetical protein